MKLIVFKKVAASMTAVLFLVPWTTYAQNSTATGAQGSQETREQSNPGVYSGREIFIPKPSEEKETETESRARSFADGFLRNTRQHVGGAIGAFQSYTPDLGGGQAASITSIVPHLFFNYQKKRFEFRMTYNIVYASYNKKLSELNGMTQNGTMSLGYAISRKKTTLQFANYFTTQYYDAISALATAFTGSYQFGFGQLYLDRRRETRDTASVVLSYAATKKGSLGGSLTYDFVKFGGRDVERADILSAGLSGSY